VNLPFRDANGFPLAYVYAKTQSTVSGEELKPAEALMIAAARPAVAWRSVVIFAHQSLVPAANL
jgi:hypothetical protein